LRESLARALSFYRTSSIAVVQSDSLDDLEKTGAVGTEFRISFKSVALSTGKPEKRVSQHVVIAPSPVKERSPVQRVRENASCWIRFRLWFNTYRCVLSIPYRALDAEINIRKFFTFIVLLNIAGLILAIVGVWQYPRKYTGALALGNLLAAILVRNELFCRFLYLLVNKLFAKVRRIHDQPDNSHAFDNPVDSPVVPSWLYLRPPTPWRDPFGLRSIWFCVAHFPPKHHLQASNDQSRPAAFHWSHDKHCCRDMHC